MYRKFFKLEGHPFGSDASCMFWGAQYCQAKGFVYESLLDENRVCCILGDAGTGKTLLLRQLFDGADDTLLVANIPRPHAAPGHFLRSVLVEFGFDPFVANTSEYLKILRAFLDHEENLGKTPVIVVDQAETLSPEVHDELARLVRVRRIEDDRLRIVFAGHKHFERDVDKTNLGQQAQRRFHIYGLAEDEVEDYVFHHLEIAGRPTRSLFTEAALGSIAAHSGGRPGLINEICIEALRKSALIKKERVIKSVVEKVVKKMGLPAQIPRSEARFSLAPHTSPFCQEAVDKIVITHSGKVLGSCLLTHRRIMIGRHPTSDVLLDRGSVSAHHAQILIDERGAHLLDLNSTNGSLVNFRKTRHHLLRHGDLIMLGDYRLKFVAGMAGSAPAGDAATTGNLTDTVVLDKHSGVKATGHLRRIK